MHSSDSLVCYHGNKNVWQLLFFFFFFFSSLFVIFFRINALEEHPVFYIYRALHKIEMQYIYKSVILHASTILLYSIQVICFRFLGIEIFNSLIAEANFNIWCTTIGAVVSNSGKTYSHVAKK